MKNLWALCMGTCVACLCLIGPASADGPASLSLKNALQLAIEASPDLKGTQAEYGAAVGERRQAGALLNPTLNFEAENIAGSGPYKGTNEAEWTVGVAQTIEIGGKRAARIRAADQRQIIANYGQQAALSDLIRDVKTAFANAAAAQEEMALANEQTKLTQRMYENVNKRVKAAAAPLVQRNKAKIQMANADLVAKRSKGQKEAAMKILGALWNSPPLASVETGDFYKIDKPKVPSQERLQDTIDYRQQAIQTEQARAILDMEQANAIPDPTFGVGVRDFRATNNQALVASVSFPLPVLNLNRGNIEKARQMVVKADSDRQKLLQDGTIRLAERSQRLENAWLTASTIKATILPEAQESFKQAQHGYTVGKFPYLEVLDAQRTLVDTRLAYIQALRDYHIEKAELERLMAKETGDTR